MRWLQTLCVTLLVATPSPLPAAADAGMPTTAGDITWEGRVRLQPTGPGPVVADVSALAAGGFALLNEQGQRVAFAVTRDADDPTLQELTFVAREGSAYVLQFRAGDGPTQWPAEDLATETLEAGSWCPLRITPVNARKAGVSPEAARQGNAAGAAQVAQGLRTEGPMWVVRAAAWEVWIGGHSGLIERLRPTGHHWAGSALREWAANLPNTADSGDTVVTRRSATRVCLRHRGQVVRDLEIWADGTILTTTEAGWTEPRLVVAGAPYATLASDRPGDDLHFDDLADRGPVARESGVLSWTGPGSALSCQITGGGFETVEAATQGDDVMALLCGATSEGLGGLCRTVVPAAWWEATAGCLGAGGDVRLDYFPRALREAPGGRFGMQQVRFGLIESVPAEPPAPEGPEALARPVVTVSPTDPEVTCYLPGRGLSLRLEPFALATANPPVVWYEVTMGAPEETDKMKLAVDAAPWLEQVLWDDPARGAVELPRVADRYEVPVAAQEGQVRLRLGLKCAEGALGPLQTTLRYVTPDVAALTGLRMRVVPSVPLFALGPGARPGAPAAGLRAAEAGEWVRLTDAAGTPAGPRMALVSQPSELSEARVLGADLPLLAPADQEGAQRLARAWQDAQAALGAAGTGTERMLVACLLPGDGPQAQHADLLALAWSCWGLGLAGGGLGWRSDLPLGYPTDEGLLPTDRLLAATRVATDVRLLSRARVAGVSQASAVELARQGRFAAARALLGE